MSDSLSDDAEPEPPDDEISRRRLIRWVALLAFAIPVVIELITFGNIFSDELLGGDENDGAPAASPTPTDRPGAVGVGDELLPETAVTETITTSELRERESGRTYVLGVDVENDTESTVELRTRRLRLRDDATVDGVSSTGAIDPGSSATVTAAWGISEDATPDAVEVVARRDGETVVETFVAVERPSIVAR